MQSLHNYSKCVRHTNPRIKKIYIMNALITCIPFLHPSKHVWIYFAASPTPSLDRLAIYTYISLTGRNNRAFINIIYRFRCNDHDGRGQTYITSHARALICEVCVCVMCWMCVLGNKGCKSQLSSCWFNWMHAGGVPARRRASCELRATGFRRSHCVCLTRRKKGREILGPAEIECSKKKCVGVAYRSVHGNMEWQLVFSRLSN